ncbi:MAG: RNA methyltransferase [Deltaproteobacteria bacterium]|nr:RNA methyltransferase [Deltaproteobacteria bacterium]
MQPSKRPGRSRQRGRRPREGTTERLFGLHSVREAILSGRRPLLRLLVRRGERRDEVAELVRAAGEAGLEVIEVEADDLAPGEDEGRGSGFSGSGNPQGVALDAGPLPELSLAELCTPAKGPRRIVALDGVEDPQNLGAIARVADASGARGMILTSHRAPRLSPAVARASAGAIEWLPVARVGNLRRALEELKTQGFWVVGADLEAPVSIYEVSDSLLQGDLVVVLGAEGRGLRPGVRALVDHPVQIPMQGRVGSLNVATAGAVVLFELLRRSQKPGA